MAITYQTTRDVPLGQLTRYPGNARRGDVEQIAASIRRHGQYRALVVRDTGDQLVILAGNHTSMALEREGHGTARCEIITCTDDEGRRINLADNRTAELGDYDDDALVELLSYLDGDYDGTGWTDEDVSALLGDADEDGGTEPAGPGPNLAERFLIAPFDVLDARSGWWRERKKQWMNVGIRSEVGRETQLAYRDPSANPDYYQQKRAAEAAAGQKIPHDEFKANHYRPTDSASKASGTSVFDPVLCELAYRWFSPPGGVVLDPFAGGSVRGITAGMLGRAYRGNDLSGEQVAANRQQLAETITRGHLDAADTSTHPVWTVGDSTAWVETLEPASADMIFTCPPYMWLERYSDDPADLSTMDADGFAKTMTGILAGCVRALRDDRFAVIVVGDVRERGSNSALVDVRAATQAAATDAGLRLLSAAVLITPIGSLAVRVGRQFSAGRVLGRTYQHVLTFYKGSRSRAAAACGHIDVTTPDSFEVDDDPGGE